MEARMNVRRTNSLLILLVILSLVLLLAACKQEEGERLDDSVMLQDPHYIMGSGLYKRHCAGCHGDRGEGHTALGPQINTQEWREGITDEEIREIILAGRRVAGTSMDSFEGALSEDEIEAIIVYIRTFR